MFVVKGKMGNRRQETGNGEQKRAKKLSRKESACTYRLSIIGSKC